jgi:hypothetical protein
MRIILTDVGEQLASEGFLTGNFPKITKVWFGDGNGATVVPDKNMTSLVNKIQEGVGTTIARFNSPNRLYIYTQIPVSVGNITVREIGLLTDDDVLIAIGGEFTNYKPPVSEAIEKMDFYINLPISSTQEITVAFSNDNIYATQDSLDIVANLEEINRLDLVEVKNTLPNKVNYSDIVNNLTDISTNKPLSAMQGKVLKTLIDNINTLLLSDNTTLDSMQEVVDFIEANRTTLNTLSIPNIAGLENALNSKLDASNYTAVDVLAKVKSLDGHGSGLDADVVDGYEGAYLAGLNYGTSTVDPNTAIYPYILTNHANTPNPSSYWHIRTQFYSSIATGSNQAQIAIQYNGGSQVWARSKYGATWTAWARLDNDGITGAASTIVTSNLTASKALVSDANGKVGTIATTATELGYVSGVTSSIQTQMDAKAPLNSPTFTGTPIGTTATLGDKSTKLATTDFVQETVGGYLSKAVTGGTVTLTEAEVSNSAIAFTGTLTSNLIVVVPTTNKRLWAIVNGTTGAFTLTIKTAAGTGVGVAQGKRNLVYTDGTNVQDAFNDFESIALTGTPTAPTAAAGTNTTQIATTAFVQGEATTTATANKLVKRDASGYIYGAAFNSTLTDTATAATHYYVETGSDGWLRPKTLANVKAELLASAALTGVPTAPTAAAGTNTTQIATTAFVMANSTQLAEFTQSLAANGYVKLPNGFIIQWGTSTGSRAGYTVTFPLAFPTACRSVVAGSIDATAYYDTRTYTYTTTTFGISNPGGTGTANHSWIATGH